MALVSLRQVLDHAAEQQIIREHGGDIRETWGVPVEEIRRGIARGVRKVNIDTDIRLAMTGAMRREHSRQPGEFDPRKALRAAKQAARSVVKARFEAFGCAGQGDRIRPVALDAMVSRYLPSGTDAVAAAS